MPRDAERAALMAEARALDTLNKELEKHRASAEKSLAEARTLLARREAALEEERASSAALHGALAQARLELEIALERNRVAAAHRPPSSRRRQLGHHVRDVHRPRAKAVRKKPRTSPQPVGANTRKARQPPRSKQHKAQRVVRLSKRRSTR